MVKRTATTISNGDLPNWIMTAGVTTAGPGAVSTCALTIARRKAARPRICKPPRPWAGVRAQPSKPRQYQDWHRRRKAGHVCGAIRQNGPCAGPAPASDAGCLPGDPGGTANLPPGQQGRYTAGPRTLTNAPASLTGRRRWTAADQAAPSLVRMGSRNHLMPSEVENVV